MEPQKLLEPVRLEDEGARGMLGFVALDYVIPLRQVP